MTVVITPTGIQELTIDTVTPAITLGDVMVSADRRSTEKAPLTEAERVRRVVIPANHWGSLTAAQNLHDSAQLAALVTKGLQAIANARLKDYLQEQPLARTVAANDYTVSALLAWNEESSKQGQVIPFTRDDIEQWFPTSQLFAALAKQGKQVTDFVGSQLAKLAAKNHGFVNADDVTGMVIWLDADTTAGNTLAATLVTRLASIVESIEAKKAAAPKMSIKDIKLS